jgi:hypothetical protein
MFIGCSHGEVAVRYVILSQPEHHASDSGLFWKKEGNILKDRRRRQEGGGEWEPIKIPHKNLAYIPNQT